jgi:hypothetical protein
LAVIFPRGASAVFVTRCATIASAARLSLTLINGITKTPTERRPLNTTPLGGTFFARCEITNHQLVNDPRPAKPPLPEWQEARRILYDCANSVPVVHYDLAVTNLVHLMGYEWCLGGAVRRRRARMTETRNEAAQPVRGWALSSEISQAA